MAGVCFFHTNIGTVRKFLNDFQILKIAWDIKFYICFKSRLITCTTSWSWWALYLTLGKYWFLIYRWIDDRQKERKLGKQIECPEGALWSWILDDIHYIVTRYDLLNTNWNTIEYCSEKQAKKSKQTNPRFYAL